MHEFLNIAHKDYPSNCQIFYNEDGRSSEDKETTRTREVSSSNLVLAKDKKINKNSEESSSTIGNLISKLNFYKLIPYPMDTQGPPTDPAISLLGV